MDTQVFLTEGFCCGFLIVTALCARGEKWFAIFLLAGSSAALLP